MKKRRRRGGREINRSTRREKSLAARGKGGCPARVNEHNPCHPDELRLEEIPSGRRGTGSRATCVLGAGWWCPAAWYTYSKPRRRRRRERGREREREAVLSVRERGCLPRNSAEPVDGGRKRGGRVARVRITAWQTKGPPR